MEHSQATAEEKGEKATAAASTTSSAAATSTTAATSAGADAAAKPPSTQAPAPAPAPAGDTQTRPSTSPSGKKESSAAPGSEEVEAVVSSDVAAKAGESGDANPAAGLWMYLDGVNPTQHGPLTESAMLKLLRIGTAHKEMMAWSQGMSEWQPLGQVKPLVT